MVNVHAQNGAVTTQTKIDNNTNSTNTDHTNSFECKHHSAEKHWQVGERAKLDELAGRLKMCEEVVGDDCHCTQIHDVCGEREWRQHTEISNQTDE